VIQGIVFATLAALGDIIGGLFVLTGPERSRRALKALAGFGAGFMLAVALVEMMPVAFAIRGGLLAVVLGYLLVHLTQHTLTPHFHFGEETHREAMVSRGIGMYALIGLLPHSFFDGVAISSGFLDSSRLGMLIFVAIVLHKVPTGVSLASVVLASGNDRRTAHLAVLAIAAATVVGAIVTPVIPPLADYGLALAAGVTLYVAASNLVPEAQHERSWFTQAALFAGVLVFYVISALFGGIE
jgi:ZIP family zinc transporter/zinc and cadmium transporter